MLNTREHATLERTLEHALHPLELEEVLRMGDGRARRCWMCASRPSTRRGIWRAA